MSKCAKVAVLISGGGTNLQAIIDRSQAGELPHAELTLVVSSCGSAGGLARAERAGIKLIPSFCGEGFYGLHVHEAALDYGVKVTGATVHFVNEITDGGKIIAQRAVEVQEGDTPEILQRRVMEDAEWKLLPAAVEKVAAEIVARRG